MALKPDTAIRLRNGVRETVAQRDLRPGDVIEVAAGGRLPADGQLLSPFASFDESALTGESVPVERQAGGTGSGGRHQRRPPGAAYRDIRTGRQRHRPHPEAD